MFAALRRRADQVRGVEFCDGCGEVCTAVCRAEARRDRVRAAALREFPFPR
jgi:Pyruvate/2-oxoacid:ferredoxin oxidoreductase delta subunit